MDELSVVDSVDAGQAQASAMRSVKDIPPGITRWMKRDDYHAERRAVPSSQLKRMRVGPAHFMCGLNEPEESTEAMLFGTVLHGRMLESDSFTARFFAMPKVNRQTKEGKALAESYRVEAAGRTMFPADWLPGIERIVDNARMHDKAREILGTGEAEVVLAWIDPETGIKCKVRVDWWHGPRVLADVKSALDVTWEGFSKACARFHYALSAAMYCEGVFQVTGETPEWAFIACEKEAPNTVAVYRASDAFLRRGQQDFRRALRYLAECRSRNHFPMLQGDGDWESIDLPRWA
jgi:exodeoxyribonuclease VIII